MEGQGSVIAKKAPEFSLADHTGQLTSLSTLLRPGPLLLVFYPGNFTPVCTKQLCNYQDFIGDFSSFGVRVAGISNNSVESHARFAAKYGFSFPLLSDPTRKTAKEYGATSTLMFGAVTRAVYIIGRSGVILYRYVEPTTLSRRKADELLGIITDLKNNALLV